MNTETPTLAELTPADSTALAKLDTIPILDNSRFHFDFFVRSKRRIIRVTNRLNGEWKEWEDRGTKLIFDEAEKWMETQKKNKE